MSPNPQTQYLRRSQRAPPPSPAAGVSLPPPLWFSDNQHLSTPSCEENEPARQLTSPYGRSCWSQQMEKRKIEAGSRDSRATVTPPGPPGLLILHQQVGDSLVPSLGVPSLTLSKLLLPLRPVLLLQSCKSSFFFRRQLRGSKRKSSPAGVQASPRRWTPLVTQDPITKSWV